MSKILVTGGCGFIGSNYVDYKLLTDSSIEIICVDTLDIGGSEDNVSEWSRNSGRYKMYNTDICDADEMSKIFAYEMPDIVVNFAAQTHVDRSLIDRTYFATTNVVGTQVILDQIIKYKTKRFVQVSTDEVYGSIDSGLFEETFMLHPNNPYSATKAGAEMLVQAAVNSFGVNASITRSCNNYGPRQYHEKLIPMVIHNALKGLPVKVFNDGLSIREWIYVLDNVIGIDTVVEKGRRGEVYNIGSGIELQNIDVVTTVLDILGKPHSLIEYTNDRANDDRRYALNCSKIFTHLEWRSKVNWKEGINQTVEWYLANKYE